MEIESCCTNANINEAELLRNVAYPDGLPHRVKWLPLIGSGEAARVPTNHRRGVTARAAEAELSPGWRARADGGFNTECGSDARRHNDSLALDGTDAPSNVLWLKVYGQ